MATSRGGDKGLVGRRKRFADEYLVCLNGTEAYKRAGYKAKNDHVASVEASKLLAKPDIAAYVAERQKTVADKLGITHKRVLQELAILGFSCVSDYTVDAIGRVKLTEGREASAMRAVSSVKRKSYTDEEGSDHVETELKLWDKPAALRMLAQHLGLMPDKVEHELGDSFASLVALAASKRAGAK